MSEVCSVALKTHKIHFPPRLCPGPRWGSLECSPKPYSRMANATHLYTFPPRRLQRLDLGVFATSKSVPNFYHGFMVTLVMPQTIQITVVGKIKLWFDLNHDLRLVVIRFRPQQIRFDRLRLIWVFEIWDLLSQIWDLKSKDLRCGLGIWFGICPPLTVILQNLRKHKLQVNYFIYFLLTWCYRVCLLFGGVEVRASDLWWRGQGYFNPSVLRLGLSIGKTHYRVREPTAAWQCVDICQHRSLWAKTAALEWCPS